MTNCEGCTIYRPYDAQYDRHRKVWLRPICYYCSNSVDGKPRVKDDYINVLAELQDEISDLKVSISKLRRTYY